MTIKTTLNLTDRHYRFISEKVSEGVFATQTAAVASAIEQMMQDDQEREIALSTLAEGIRARMQTVRSGYVDDARTFRQLVSPSRRLAADDLTCPLPSARGTRLGQHRSMEFAGSRPPADWSRPDTVGSTG